MPEKRIKQILSNEKNLVRILDNLKEGIIAHDLNRCIFFFNREAERITGYSREEVLNADCHDAFGAPFCGERCLFKDGSSYVPDTAEYPVSFITKDGETRNVEMSVTAIRDDAGEIFGVIAFIKDITDIVRFQLRTGELSGYSNIVGRDRKMLQIFQQIDQISNANKELAHGTVEIDKLKDFSLPEIDGVVGTIKNSASFIKQKTIEFKNVLVYIVSNTGDIIKNLLKLTFLYVGIFLIQVILLPLLSFWFLVKTFNTLFGTNVPASLHH